MAEEKKIDWTELLAEILVGTVRKTVEDVVNKDAEIEDKAGVMDELDRSGAIKDAAHNAAEVMVDTVKQTKEELKKSYEPLKEVLGEIRKDLANMMEKLSEAVDSKKFQEGIENALAAEILSQTEGEDGGEGVETTDGETEDEGEAAVYDIDEVLAELPDRVREIGDGIKSVTEELGKLTDAETGAAAEQGVTEPEEGEGTDEDGEAED